MKLYHLTHPDNVERIKSEGIRADDEGMIFAFTDMLVANTIAKNQVMLNRFAVFQIMPRGITGEIERDNVAEYTAALHRIIRQASIAPNALKFVGEFETITDRPTEWDYLIGDRHGKSGEYVDGEFAIFRWMERQPRTKATATKVNRRMAELLRKYPPKAV